MQLTRVRRALTGFAAALVLVPLTACAEQKAQASPPSPAPPRPPSE